VACTYSNNGGDAITEKTLDHWANGQPREHLQLFDMEQLLTLRAFNEKGFKLLFVELHTKMHNCKQALLLIIWTVDSAK